jgi:hypothetical protein
MQKLKKQYDKSKKKPYPSNAQHNHLLPPTVTKLDKRVRVYPTLPGTADPDLQIANRVYEGLLLVRPQKEGLRVVHFL